jgi:hypothetical protein
MPTVPLPPWLRRWQQWWLYQNAIMPIAVGFVSSLVLQGCLKDLFHIEFDCVHTAVNACGSSLLTAWVKGHSAGSSDFKTDGTPIPAAPELKQLADKAIVLQAKATDPADPTTQAQATEAAATVERVGVVVSNVLASAK